MKLWMVTCDYLAGYDYGINLGLVGIYDTQEAATKALDETLKFLEATYPPEDEEDRNDLESYVRVHLVETNQTYSCKIAKRSYSWDTSCYPYETNIECNPDVQLGSYNE